MELTANLQDPGVVLQLLAIVSLTILNCGRRLSGCRMVFGFMACTSIVRLGLDFNLVISTVSMHDILVTYAAANRTVSIR